MFQKAFKALTKSSSSRFFCSSKFDPTNKLNTSQVLHRHIRDIKLSSFDASKMKISSKSTQVPGTRLNQLNFLKPFGDFAKYIGVYAIRDTPKLEGANTPSASWVGINLPLKDDQYVKNLFKKFHTDGLRIGKLMEMLDLLASCSVYRYMGSDIQQRETTAVTLCVDNFQIFVDNINTDKDIFMSSYVTYVGSTSLEIRLDVTYSEQPEKLLASAFYFFVVREASDYSKAKKVPKLVFDQEEDVEGCVLRNEQGKINQNKRKQAAAHSTLKVAPTSEESEDLHKLYQATLKPDFKDTYVPISETSCEKTGLMHSADRNIHGKIFGGYLMKEAGDLGWVTSFMHGPGDYPNFLHIDDVAFLNPVEIGSIATFKSYITYVEENLAHVMVTVDTMKNKFEKNRTCEFHLTLAHKGELKKVVPISYAESMMYVEGKRRIDAIKNVKSN